MDNGFYATLVEGNVAQTGITVIEDNRIRGGDAEFLYSGTIELTGEDVVANLRFRSYTASDNHSFVDFTERDIVTDIDKLTYKLPRIKRIFKVLQRQE